MSDQSQPTETRNPSRLFWTFLFYTLAGPFIAGLVAAAVAIALGDIAGMPDVPNPGEFGISIYLWSAIPAAFTALMLLPLVWTKGRFGVPEAGIAGVVAFGIAYFLSPLPLGGAIAYAAFIAGLISVAVRQILISGKIIQP